MAIYDKKFTAALGTLPALWTGPTPQLLKDAADATRIWLIVTDATNGGVALIDYDDGDPSGNGTLIAYAVLANVVAVAQDATYIYLGTTTAGIYRILKSAFTTGNVTPGGWAAWLSTATSPAIYSNVIATCGLAWNTAETRLAISCGGRVTLFDVAGDATYDSSELSACTGAIAADGNRLAWVRNGEVGIVCVLEDMTVPVADGWVAPPYGHFSDDFAGTGAPDTARWAIEVSGSPTSTTATRSGGALLLGLTHRNAAGTDSVRAYCAQPAIGVSDFSLKITFGAATIPTLEAGSDDVISCPVDLQIFDSTWAQQVYLVIAGYKKAASEYIGASLYRGGSLIFSTNVTQNWVAGVTFYLERSGTTISASYDNGGGKTQISADSHADNANNGRLWYRVRLDHAEVVTPFNRASRIQVADFQVVTPASYDSIPTALINSLAIKSGADTTRLLIGTADGAAIIDTDESAPWSSLPNFTVETYGITGSGADNEVIHGASNAVQAVTMDSDATPTSGHIFVGTDTGGVTVVNLADNTRAGWFDSSGGEWGGLAIEQSAVDSIKALTVLNASNAKFAYGGSGGVITPDIDAPGDISALGVWGDELDSLLIRWTLATDPDVRGYNVGYYDGSDWYGLTSDYDWEVTPDDADYLEVADAEEAAALRVVDLAAGRYMVRVRAVDYAGNRGDWTDSDWIYIGAPSALTLLIDGGAETTLNRAVMLTVSGLSNAAAGSIANYGINQVAFSDDGTTWGEWRMFTPGAANEYEASIPVGYQHHTVYVKGRDEAGNESAAFSAVIELIAPADPNVRYPDAPRDGAQVSGAIRPATADEYGDALRRLLPQGQIFSNMNPEGGLWSLFDGMGVELAAVHNAFINGLAESDPRETTDLIDEWEDLVGVPDIYPPLTGTPLENRRAVVVAAYTMQPEQTPAYIQRVMAPLVGYDDVEIVEWHDPDIWGDTVYRFVVLLDPEQLSEDFDWAAAQAIITKIKPAHTDGRVLYPGLICDGGAETTIDRYALM